MSDLLHKQIMLWNICEQFIEKQRIGCAETVYQSDRVIKNASEFIEEICETVGYYEDEEEDLDDDDE